VFGAIDHHLGVDFEARRNHELFAKSLCFGKNLGSWDETKGNQEKFQVQISKK
jgi:hypothetical protein